MTEEDMMALADTSWNGLQYAVFIVTESTGGNWSQFTM